MFNVNVSLKHVKKERCGTLIASAVKEMKLCHLQMTSHATNWQDYATC